MAMALKRDVLVAQSKCGEAKPIDLVHLCTQTMGDRFLETEILAIFTNQAKVLVNLINTGSKSKNISEAAHSLKGACKGIGAFKLAQVAEQIEKSGVANDNLQIELDAACDYIASLKR